MKTKSPLLLLSGLLCDDTVWQAIADQITDVADVTMMSFQNHETIKAMAEQVLTFAPKTFALAGHSMGGRVALEVYRQALSRVERLALFNTGIHSKKENELQGRQKLLSLAKDEGMMAVAKAWLPPMMSATSLTDTALMNGLEAMVARYSTENFFKQIQALLARPNAKNVLTTISVPTLLLSGSDDQWSPVAQHQAMQQKIKNSRMAIIENAGHMAPAERPNEVSNVIRQWLME